MPRVRCDGCGKKHGKRRGIASRSGDVHRRRPPTLPGIQVKKGNRFCKACRRRLCNRRRIASQSTMTMESASDRSSSSFDSSGSMDEDYEPPASRLPPAERIEVEYERVVSTESRCFVCGSTGTRRKVPEQVRKQAFMRRRLFIPKTNRCCSAHLVGDRLAEDDLMGLQVEASTSHVEAKEVEEYREMFTNDSDAALSDLPATSSTGTPISEPQFQNPSPSPSDSPETGRKGEAARRRPREPSD